MALLLRFLTSFCSKIVCLALLGGLLCTSAANAQTPLYVSGVVTTDNQQIESLSGQYVLSLAPYGVPPPAGTYQWLKNEQPVLANGAYFYYMPDGSGVYRLRYTPPTGPAQLTTCVIINLSAGTSSRNHAIVDKTRTDKIKETQNFDQLSKLSKQTAITYQDGFGRPLQQIAVNASAGTDKDLVQPFSYDPQGEQTKSYLPFAGGYNGQYKDNWQSAQTNFYQGGSPKVGRAGSNGPAYSEAATDSDPLGRVSEKASPGEPWKMGSGHTQKTAQRSNTTADDVRLWTYTPGAGIGVTGTLTKTAAAAPANTLSVVEVRDEDGNWSALFTDEKGQTVCRRTYLSGTPQEPVMASYLETAYAYDATGHRLAAVPPKAVQQLLNGTATATVAFLNQYIFITQYDALGRSIAHKVPGKGWAYTVYDRWDRVAATQDPIQNGAGVWSFTKYDALNRAIMTGEVVDSRTPSALATALQSWPVERRAERRADNQAGYTLTLTFPDNAVVNDVGTVDYYDDYDYFPLRAAQRPDLAFVAELDNAASSTQMRGMRTGGRTRTFSTTNYTDYDKWLTSVVYYDQYGRSIQVLQDNFTSKRPGSAPAVDRTTLKLAFTGETQASRLTHTRFDATGTLETHTTNLLNYYDRNGNLTNIKESIDNGVEVFIAGFEYNELGQLVDKKLGYDYTNGSYIQSLDYRYNIRGWLTNINNRNLSNNEWLDNSEPNSDTEPQDAFGLELKYESGSTTAGCYNGNISAGIWNTLGGKMRQYGYEYDGASRLKAGKYGALNYVNGQYSFTAEKDDALGEGRYTTSGITYDPNGNITALNRSGFASRNPATGAKIFGHIDELTFAHDGNRLRTVTDRIATSMATNDFESTAASGEAYEYDDNGNLTYDPNKKVSIRYNRLNLPWAYSFDNGKQILVNYTSTGQKINTTYSTSTRTGYTSKVVQYIQGFTYSSSAAEPLTVATPTGRAIFEGAATATTPALWGHEYHIRDQQGSLRLVLKQDPVTSYRLSMEVANAPEEEAHFKRVAETRQLDGSHARTGGSSARLNAYQVDRANGPATVLTVAAGDSVNLEVFGLYDKGVAGPRLSKAVTPLLAIGGSLTTVSASGPDNQQQAPRRWIPAITAGAAVAWDNLRGLFGKHPAPPQASFTYELYNQDSVLVSSATCQLADIGQPEWQALRHGFRAKEGGYVKVYLANASGTNAWFDDLVLSRFPVPTKQENHYDPFGQNLEEIELASSFDSKEQYTGKERVKDFGLEWTDYGFRNYDAQLGRWHSTDPADQYSSPYTAMGNNHVNSLDQDGQFAWALAALSGGFLNLGMNFNNVDSFGQGLAYFASGAAAGMLGAGVGSGVNSALGGGSFGAGFAQSAAAHHTTGLIAGALSGAAGGLTGGFIGGFGNAAAGGASWEEALSAGMASGLSGGLSGGVLGGLSGLTDAAFRGRNLLTGDMISHPMSIPLMASTGGVIDLQNESYSVWNTSNSDIYTKPEDGPYGMQNKVPPGESIDDPVDGIATARYKDKVFKVPGKGIFHPSALVTPDGNVNLNFGPLDRGALYLKQTTTPGYTYGWMTKSQLDSNWYKLFQYARYIK